MVAWQDDFPVSTYRMGFVAQPLDPLGGITWTDLTTFTPADGIQRLRVLGRHTVAGRQPEQDTVDASRGKYTVDNRDGAFYPTNTASPLYPNVRLDVVFQERQTWAGTTYDVFTGFVEDVDVQADELGKPVVVLSCVDASKFLNLDKLDESAFRIEVRKDVSTNIAAGRNTVWLRFADAANSDVAADYGGMGFDGRYQNGPVLGGASLVAGDTDTCMDVLSGADQRASLPYKHLITGYPATIEWVFRCWPDRARGRFFLSAYSSPNLGNGQFVEILMIDSGTSPTDAGKIAVLVANPYPTGTQVISTAAVDDGNVHHATAVLSSSTSFSLYVDGANVSNLTAATAHTWPNDLLTDYAIGNTPASPFGDFPLDAGSSVDADGNPIFGGIQSMVIYDGLALSPARIAAHATAALTGWGQESSGARINHILDAIGWPSADRDIDTGSATVIAGVPGGTGLAHINLVEQTEQGRSYIAPSGKPTFRGRTYPILNSRATTAQAVFSDDGAGGTIPYVPPFEPHLDDLDLWYRASVTRVGGSPQVYDATPGSNATRTLAKTGLLMPTDTDARGMAQHLANRRKLATSRVRVLTFHPQQSPTLGWPAALGLRQGDRITTRRNFEGTASAWVQDWIVEGIEHDDPSGEVPWTTHLTLSLADPHTYFLIGSSLIGGPDVLFF